MIYLQPNILAHSTGSKFLRRLVSRATIASNIERKLLAKTKATTDELTVALRDPALVRPSFKIKA